MTWFVIHGALQPLNSVLDGMIIAPNFYSLITNSPAPEESFDPSTYVIGPEEDLPRKLDYFTFVMHAPDDYFYYRKAPYPTMAIETDQEYLITRMTERVRIIKAGKPVYQPSVPPLIPMPISSGGSS